MNADAGGSGHPRRSEFSTGPSTRIGPFPDRHPSFGIWPAVASFTEREPGSLTPGKRAGFVILDQDIMRVPASLLLRTNVLATCLDGRAGYERPAERAAQP